MIPVSSSDVYMLMFYLTIVNKTRITVTPGWHDSSKEFQAFIYIYYKSFDIHRCSSPTGTFTHFAIFWNRKTQRSFIRVCGTYKSITWISLYLLLLTILIYPRLRV